MEKGNVDRELKRLVNEMRRDRSRIDVPKAPVNPEADAHTAPKDPTTIL